MQKFNAKLIIFDFDGTLSDSGEAIVEGINRVFEMNGFSRKPKKDILEQVGLPIEVIFENLESKFEKTDENTKKLVADFKKVYYEDLQYKTKLFAGIKELLGELHKKGKILAIASSKKHDPLIKMLEHYDIKKFFKFIVGADDVANRKPAPDMVEKILKESGFRKEDAIVVGDTHFDVEMAHNAGVKCCAVTYGIGTKESLIAAKPDFLVNSVSELRKIIE